MEEGVKRFQLRMVHEWYWKMFDIVLENLEKSGNLKNCIA